jgi:hypothetical protein
MRALTTAMLFGVFLLGTSHAFAQSAPPAYSANGLYNQANAFARAGKPGLAVLNYERAELLAPDDPDIRANLAYVRAAAHIAVKPTNALTRMMLGVGPTLAAWLGVLGLIVAGVAMLLLRKGTPRLRWPARTGIVVGTAMIALTATQAVLLSSRLHEAIVLVDQTPALVTPALMGDTAFVLQEAQSVVMTAQHEDFILIRTGSGLVGWVARANLGPVVPDPVASGH